MSSVFLSIPTDQLIPGIWPTIHSPRSDEEAFTVYSSESSQLTHTQGINLPRFNLLYY